VSIVPVQNLALELLAGATPYTLRWYRHGIAPPGVAAKRLAEHLNALMAQQCRVVFAHAGVYRPDSNTGGIFEGFDTESNSDLTTYRVAFHTGPVTRRLKVKMVLLPPDSETTATSAAYAQWTLTVGLTGSGSATVQSAITVPTQSGLTDDFQAFELFEAEQYIDVSPDTNYRMELHQVNRMRVVSCSIFEEPRTSLDTTIDTYAVDPTPFVQARPITQQQYRDLMVAANAVWRIGQPLIQWTADVASAGTNLGHEPRSRTSATAANVLDQSYTAANESAPGYTIEIPYSGTLESGNVPVVMWAYASCTGGTGAITFKNQAGTTLGSLAPAGAANWYSTTGNFVDASGTTETTKVDVLFAGDGANACVVYAFGAFVHTGETTLPTSHLSTSWLPSIEPPVLEDDDWPIGSTTQPPL
jgi:hypothetical protein